MRPRGLRVHLLGLDEGARTLQTHRITPHPGTVHLGRVRAVHRLRETAAGDGIAGRGPSRESNRATPSNLESTRCRVPAEERHSVRQNRSTFRSISPKAQQTLAPQA